MTAWLARRHLRKRKACGVDRTSSGADIFFRFGGVVICSSRQRLKSLHPHRIPSRTMSPTTGSGEPMTSFEKLLSGRADRETPPHPPTHKKMKITVGIGKECFQSEQGRSGAPLETTVAKRQGCRHQSRWLEAGLRGSLIFLIKWS